VAAGEAVETLDDMTRTARGTLTERRALGAEADFNPRAGRALGRSDVCIARRVSTVYSEVAGEYSASCEWSLRRIRGLSSGRHRIAGVSEIMPWISARRESDSVLGRSLEKRKIDCRDEILLFPPAASSSQRGERASRLQSHASAPRARSLVPRHPPLTLFRAWALGDFAPSVTGHGNGKAMSYLVAFPSACSSAPVPKRGERSSARFGGENARSASHGHAARGGFPAASRARLTSVSLAAPDSSNVSTDVSLEDQLAAPASVPPPSVAESAFEPPSPPVSAQTEPAKTSFQKRVEAAAAALKSGRASQTRRQAPTAAPAPSGGVAAAPARPAPAGRAPARPSKGGASPLAGAAPSLIEKSESESEMAASQRRLFEQMVTLRTRLNERLAASNKFAKFLEFTLQQRDVDLKHANERLVAAMLEIDSLRAIVQDAAEAVEKEQAGGLGETSVTDTKSVNAVARLETVTRRLDLMSKALKKDVEKIDAACIKTVPIRWVGMASDIRIMGSFDHWTKGVAMSPEHIEGGSNVFVADMNLVAGTYEIKFVVDGIWQTAQEWPTTGDGLDANNLLIVE